MTAPIDPQGTFKVYLDATADAAQDQRPYFAFRRLNGREWRRLAEMSDSLGDSTKTMDAIDLVYESVRIGLVGWGNQIDPATGDVVPFKPEDLDLVLDPVDAQEVIGKKMAGGRVQVEEKKG